MREVNNRYLSVYPIAIETRVIVPTREQLDAFSFAELKRYAEGIEIKPAKTKAETIERLLKTGKATLCANLGD